MCTVTFPKIDVCSPNYGIGLHKLLKFNHSHLELFMRKLVFWGPFEGPLPISGAETT
jgi:hypothetical protein